MIWWGMVPWSFLFQFLNDKIIYNIYHQEDTLKIEILNKACFGKCTESKPVGSFWNQKKVDPNQEMTFQYIRKIISYESAKNASCPQVICIYIYIYWVIYSNSPQIIS